MWSAGWTVTAATLAAGIAACGGGPVAPDGAASVDADVPVTDGLVADAAPDASPDAPPDGSPTSDASPDASPDASSDAAPAGRVDVAVFLLDSRGLVDPDATAIFVDPSGAVVQDAQVDANGQAHADLPAGSSVTVIQGFTEGNSISRTITTIRGVKPGDELTVGAPADNPYWVGAPQSQMFANATPPPTGSFVNVVTPCQGIGGDVGSPIPLTFGAACQPATFDLIAHAGNPATQTVSYVWQPGNTLAAGGTIEISNAWQPMSASMVTLSNVPDLLHYVGARVGTVIGRQSWLLMSSDVNLPAPGTHVLALQYPPNAQRSYAVAEAIRNNRYVDRITRFSSALGTVAIDFAATPPRPTALVQSQTGAVWTETTGTADARIFEWDGRWTTGAMTHYTREVVIEPWSAGAQTSLPVLPAAHADDDPTLVNPGVLVLQAAHVSYVDYSNTDYDGIRSEPLGVQATDYLFRDVDHDVHYTQDTN